MNRRASIVEARFYRVTRIAHGRSFRFAIIYTPGSVSSSKFRRIQLGRLLRGSWVSSMQISERKPNRFLVSNDTSSHDYTRPSANHPVCRDVRSYLCYLFCEIIALADSQGRDSRSLLDEKSQLRLALLSENVKRFLQGEKARFETRSSVTWLDLCVDACR